MAVYLVVAYGVIWVGVSLYLENLSRRERSLDSEMRDLKAHLGYEGVAEQPG